MKESWLAEGSRQVSNLLGSPASGEPTAAATATTVDSDGFQFIGFPSEWGVIIKEQQQEVRRPFPIYWVPQRVGSHNASQFQECLELVSNLLGSPASGELTMQELKLLLQFVSNLLGSPASGEPSSIGGVGRPS